MHGRWTWCLVTAAVGVLLVGTAVVLWGVGWGGGGTHHLDAPATIDRIDQVPAGRSGAARVLTVRFTTLDGVEHSAAVDAGSSSGALEVGGGVTVSYDPADPGDVRLAGSASDPSVVPPLLAVVAGVGLLAMAGLAAWRLRRLGRLLRDNPWVVVDSKAVELALDGPGGRSVLRMLELHGAPDEGTVLAVPLAIRARLVDHLAPQAWVAGSGRRFVASAPGGSRLLRMRRARLSGNPREPERPPLRSRLDNGD
jgi:hypothetical protein